MIDGLLQTMQKQDCSIEQNVKDMNITNEELSEVIMYAAMYGRKNFLEKFLEHKKSVETEQKIKINLEFHSEDIVTSPLFEAVFNNHHECVKLLVDYGIDPDFKNINGFTAIMIAAKYGHKKCVELLGKSSDLTIRDTSSQRTAIDWAKDINIALYLRGQQRLKSSSDIPMGTPSQNKKNMVNRM